MISPKDNNLSERIENIIASDDKQKEKFLNHQKSRIKELQTIKEWKIKKSNYLNMIISLRDEIQKKTDEFKKEIKPLEDALHDLRMINTACEYCNGTGSFYTYDATWHREQLTCTYCRGTGEVSYCSENGQ